MSLVQIKVLFFGSSKDLTGYSHDLFELENPNLNGNDLVELILKKYPRQFSNSLSNIRWAPKL